MSNYYLALGIEQDADLNKIKQAYRICCKKYHPDSGVGDRDKQRFLRIQEAYETLSDTDKRRDYDRRLEEQENRGGEFRSRTERQPRQPESFRSPFSPSVFGRTPSKRTFGGFTSLLDEFFRGFVPGFFDDPFSPDKELYAEIILSPEEARTGGELPIEIPVIAECSSCGGRGLRAGGICMDCYGKGRVQTKRTLRLHVPAGIYDGAETRVSLEGIGIPDVFLNVEVTVSA